jgi:hypothetical protein
MQLGCTRAGVLLERQGSGLSEAEQILLEDHLAGCDRCFADAKALRAMGELSSSFAGEHFLVEQQRERALVRALDLSKRRAPSERRRPRLVFALPLAAAGLALSSGLLIWSGTSREGDRVLSGFVSTVERPIALGETIPSNTVLTAGNDATLAVAHARAHLAAGAEVVWRADVETLILQSRAIDVSVDPQPHRRFRVITDHFSVEVMGTRFHVDALGVRVSEGVVQIRGTDGAILVEHLGPGQSYTVPAPVEAPAKPPELSTVEASPAPEAPSRNVAPANHRARFEPRSSAPASAELAKARRALSEGDISGARSVLADVRARRLVRRDQAEADTLEAECALVARDSEGAVSRYLEIARAYGDLPAGENALFAAARIEADAGHKDKAVEHLDAYLAAHPHGRFHEEAIARLSALSGDPK